MITVKDVIELKERLENFSKTAEQYQFCDIFRCEILMHNLCSWAKDGNIPQDTASKIFAVVTKVIGENNENY